MTLADRHSAPFDQFQRYQISSELVAAVCGPACDVLEIGANVHSNLSRFLPSARITFLDSEMPTDGALAPNWVVGDARALDMPDGSFDAVIGLDMLEHVPAAGRERVLAEALRVARRVAVFTFPADDPALRDAEARTNAIWVRHFGQDYRWLAEHAIEGLPRLDDIRAIAGALTPHVHVVGHGELTLWRSMMSMHLIKEAYGELALAVAALDRLYNRALYAGDFAPSVYRQVLVLARDEAASRAVSSHLAARARPSCGPIEADLSGAVIALCGGLESLADRLGKTERTLGETQAEARRAAEHAERLDGELDRLRRDNAVLVASLHEVWSSSSWRLTAPYRRVGFQAARALRLGRRAPALVRRAGGPVAASRRALSVLAAEGLSGIARRLRHRPEAATDPGADPSAADRYACWIEAVEPHLMAEATAGAAAHATRFSVVMPVFNTDPVMLDEAIRSVVEQDYPQWELCIADDCSTRPETAETLRRWAAGDARIRVVWRERNGHIAEASASALSIATGDWVLLLDHDDLLARGAMAALSNRIAEDEGLDLLYSDEDHVDPAGRRVLPFFKPDWSPSLAQRQGYVGHLICVRRSVALACGGFRPGYEGSQDHDLLLRASRHARRIGHVPLILYHWREHERSTAARPDSKPYAHDAGRRAIADHLATVYGERFERVDDGEHLFTYVPRFRMPPRCRVSIIIPTRDKVDLLKACIDSIQARSMWQDYEIIVCDNGSVEAATHDYLHALVSSEARARVIPCPIPFNWSMLNNIGAREATGDVLLFLNNDIEVLTPEWLEILASHALLPDVGTVGALLLYEDRTIQHAGVIVGMNQWADHVFKATRPVHVYSPFVSPVIGRNVLAVTGACITIARDKFERLGRFDESFVICGSDVELGLRAYRSGLVNEYLPEARLIHYESKTRGTSVPENDFVRSDQAYAPWRTERVDPYFNANLDRMSLVPRIAVPGK